MSVPKLCVTLPHVPSTLSPNERRLLTVGVAGVHLLALWGLLQVHGAPLLVREQLPLVVHLLTVSPPATPPDLPNLPVPPTPAAPSRPQPPQRPAQAPVQTEAQGQLVPAAVTAAPADAPAPTLAASFVAAPETPSQPMAAAPAPPAPPAPPALPPAPKAVSASALRYAVVPPIELPVASRRLGESGTVLLQVVFDTQGRVKQVSLLRSSGFARLDEQALGAMRQARIVPYLDNGQPVQVVAQAPLVYELE